MQRIPSQLESQEFDLVVVGGGIYGVCSAWDATLRGLSVALIEKGDFCGGTSANHYKVVHGGIRYLQHLDIPRVRESSNVRNVLLRIAPHLVEPLPFVMPTYGFGAKGKHILRVGLSLYDLFTFDRSRGIEDKERKIPNSNFFSRKEMLDMFPGIEEKGLTGGGLFYDGQMYNPPRLALSFLRAAVEKGAVAANYMEADAFILKGNDIKGIQAIDRLTGDKITIRGKVVLNTTGPWAHRLLDKGLGITLEPYPVFSRDLAMVINKEPTIKYGVAYTTGTADADSVIDRGGRHLFVVPWRDFTLLGVWHKVFEGPPESIRVTEADVSEFIREANSANPNLKITISDVTMINTGLTLFGEKSKQSKNKMSFGKRSRLIDHSKQDNYNGLVTLIGVRATTAQDMAVKAIDLIQEQLGVRKTPSTTHETHIFGGDIRHFTRFKNSVIEEFKSRIDPKVMYCLLRNYGSRYKDVLNVEPNKGSGQVIKNTTNLQAEVLHAVRNEMAIRLSDVLFRRTDIATAGNPGDEALVCCARIMAKEFKWNDAKISDELEDAKAVFPPENIKY